MQNSRSQCFTTRRTHHWLIRLTQICVVAALALRLSEPASAADLEASQGGLQSQPEVIAWLKKEMSDSDLAALSRDNLQISGEVCSCFDPTPHYPYALLKLSLKTSVFIARVEGNETGFRLRPIAIQRGNRYFLNDGDEVYFGEYDTTCEFIDARFGKTLAPFFPDCKTGAAESKESPR